MGNPVYANNMSVACKSGDAKVICAFPDVCLSPPTPPAGPIPIPYPVTSMSSDTTDGSGTVKINNKEVMLKDKSCYKKCMGDEAATKTLGMGLMNANLGGKTFFKMWSMDVKAEGENVVRAFDITTSNHMSEIGNATVPMINTERLAFATLDACKGVDKKYELLPYKSTDPATNQETESCARATPPMTGHHLIPGRCMQMHPKTPANPSGYPPPCSHDKAPVICIADPPGANQWAKHHKKLHSRFDPVENRHAKRPPKNRMTYKAARNAAAASVAGVKRNKKLTDAQFECLKAQLDDYYKQCLETNNDGSIKLNQTIKASSAGRPAQVI
jgi:hypothetical protein